MNLLGCMRFVQCLPVSLTSSSQQYTPCCYLYYWCVQHKLFKLFRYGPHHGCCDYIDFISFWKSTQKGIYSFVIPMWDFEGWAQASSENYWVQMFIEWVDGLSDWEIKLSSKWWMDIVYLYTNYSGWYFWWWKTLMSTFFSFRY